MSLVLQVYIKIKPENVASFMQKAIENGRAARNEKGCQQFEVHQQGAAFKKYVAEAVPLLASRERHFWNKAL